MPHFSIILPVLNEAVALPGTLAALTLLDPAPEILVVDGGSTDRTRDVAGGRPTVRVLSAPRGRAAQMNVGAAAATGDWFLFLHADTMLSVPAYAAAQRLVHANEAPWGWFDVQFDDGRLLYRLHGRLISLRARWRGTPTGDQGLLVRRDTFTAAGGFPDLPLMEDVAFVRRLRAQHAGCRVPHPVVTSARQWREHGFWRTVLRIWWFKLQYAAGRDPQALADRYRHVRETAEARKMTGVSS